jgi:hypothetical protein
MNADDPDHGILPGRSRQTALAVIIYEIGRKGKLLDAAVSATARRCHSVQAGARLAAENLGRVADRRTRPGNEAPSWN